MIRRLGNMVKMVGQGASPNARSSATSRTQIDLAAMNAFLFDGEILRTNDDGSYEVRISTPNEGSFQESCFSTTDEPLEKGTVVLVCKTIYETWVIVGGSRVLHSA